MDCATKCFDAARWSFFCSAVGFFAPLYVASGAAQRLRAPFQPTKWREFDSEITERRELLGTQAKFLRLGVRDGIRNWLLTAS